MGPIYINDAMPGDVLKVEFLSLETASYGWTAILPGFGLLSDEFLEPKLKIWDLEEHAYEGFAEFKEGIRIPIRPFLGVMGVAREEDGECEFDVPNLWGMKSREVLAILDRLE